MFPRLSLLCNSTTTLYQRTRLWKDLMNFRDCLAGAVLQSTAMSATRSRSTARDHVFPYGGNQSEIIERNFSLAPTTRLSIALAFHTRKTPSIGLSSARSATTLSKLGDLEFFYLAVERLHLLPTPYALCSMQRILGRVAPDLN